MNLKLTMLTATLVTALGISACSSPSQPSASLPPNKDTLIIANGAEPATLDPQKSQDTTSSAIIRQMFEGLVMTDAQGKIIPGLAESWETTDNKVWTFKLRDANWSNGDAISAHDAVFALQRLVDPATAAYYSRACPYLDNEAKNRLNRQQNKANCADNIGILSNNLTQFCQI